MKKFLFALIAVVALVSPTSLSAVKYRGFVEAAYLIKPSGPWYDEDSGFLSSSSVDITTSHGIQINKVFAGVGVGANLVALNDVVTTLPFFLHGRYDFFSGKGFNPYVSFKIGYIHTFTDSSIYGPDYIDESTISYDEYGYQNAKGEHIGYKPSGIYMSPQVGIRIRLGRSAGLNFGVSCSLYGCKNKIYEATFFNHHDYWYLDRIEGELKKTNHNIKGAIGITIGVDF